MKKIAAFFFCMGFVLCAKADHITGGEIYYAYAGFSNGEYQYSGTLKLFMRCNSGRFFSDPTVISIFDRGSGAYVKDISAPLANQETLSMYNSNPCITDPPVVCYEVGYFYFTVSLPPSINGYLISSQVNFRIANISNLGEYAQVGATYTAEIPGTALVNEAPKNSSAHFSGSDLVIVCADNSFSYSFAASDLDNDQLKYSFCNAYAGGGGGSPGNSQPPSKPPYTSVPYAGPDFTGSTPLGGKVQINENTGLITGIAPSDGKYVVTVCVQEIRNGIVIATQRKDLQINITSCTIAAATLNPLYSVCKDSKTITLSNLSTSALIKTFNWQLLNSNGTAIFSSTQPAPSYTFADTGIYLIKLNINKNELCEDSAKSEVKVYPGFKPGFSSSGVCITKPILFRDASTSTYGTVNSWTWDFGENSRYDDFSSSQNTSYSYPLQGLKNVRLIVTDSKGCLDTLTREVAIIEKPLLKLAFRDTLICITDKVQLQAEGVGVFAWTPLTNIINEGSVSPTVSPTGNTTYFVNLDDNGCKNHDSVNVRVVSSVKLQMMADTVVCSTDPVQLHVVSDGLKYSWQPAAQFADPGLQNPIVIANSNTLYEVTASIGSCSVKDRVMVNAVPYPVAKAGTDTIICFNTSAQLFGVTDGNSFTWTPASSLSSGSVLNPVAKPTRTTKYVLMAYDNKGCPKPGTDTVQVTMLPNIYPYAGNDTTVVINQPLQLNAYGGTKYVWVPATNLSSANIANPVAIIKEASAGFQYKVLVYNEANCVDSAFVKVKVYKTLPTVFVPNAFTPNGDGQNDRLRPIAAGILRMEYFNVYNRWGQLVFSYKDLESGGWNGKLAGKDQEPGTYLWVLKAIDYNGLPYTAKGTAVLIR